MAFMMNVTSCQVTSLTGDLGAKSARYAQDYSTNPVLQDNNLSAVMKNDGLSFPSASVQSSQAQSVGGIDNGGRGIA